MVPNFELKPEPTTTTTAYPESTSETRSKGKKRFIADLLSSECST